MINIKLIWKWNQNSKFEFPARKKNITWMRINESKVFFHIHGQHTHRKKWTKRKRIFFLFLREEDIKSNQMNTESIKLVKLFMRKTHDNGPKKKKTWWWWWWWETKRKKRNSDYYYHTMKRQWWQQTNINNNNQQQQQKKIRLKLWKPYSFYTFFSFIHIWNLNQF